MNFPGEPGPQPKRSVDVVIDLGADYRITSVSRRVKKSIPGDNYLVAGIFGWKNDNTNQYLYTSSPHPYFHTVDPDTWTTLSVGIDLIARWVRVDAGYGGAGGEIALDDVIITYDSPCASPTPTPSPTATIPAPPTPPTHPGGAMTMDCPLLNNVNANFAYRHRWHLEGGASVSHAGLRMVDEATATIDMYLSRYNEYAIYVVWQRGTGAGESPVAMLTAFGVQLGRDAPQEIKSPGDTSEHTFTIPAGNYNPNDLGSVDRYELVIHSPASYTSIIAPQVELLIKSICVVDQSDTATFDPRTGTTYDPNVQAGLPSMISATECRSCSYQPTGDLIADFVRIIEWLWCSLAQIIECTLIPFLLNLLYGLWKTAVQGLQSLAFFRDWLGLGIGDAFAFVLSGAQGGLSWANGHAANIRALIVNLLERILSNSDLVALINRIGEFFTGLFAWNRTAPTTTVGGDPNPVQSVINFAGDLLSFIFGPFVTWLAQVVESIVALWASVGAALNAPATPPPGVALCDDFAAQIPENCLPLWMISNTILADASMLGSIIPFLKGGASLGLLWWAVGKFRNSLAGEME
jgi:hypothetical protein